MKFKLLALVFLLPLLAQAQETQELSLNVVINDGEGVKATASVNTDLRTRTVASIICIGVAKTYELTAPTGVVTIACTTDPGMTISTVDGLQVGLKVVPSQ